MVSFWGGFHGKTGGVIGHIGDEWKQGYGPLPGGRYLVPYADCYRCPFKLSYPSCGIACADFARQQIKNSSAGAISAILVEPIQGTAGNVIPPDDWMHAIKSIAKENGALLIADEMITGFGRTGKMWGIEHSGVEADIVTVGKGMGSGFPVSGVLMSDELSQAEPFSKPSSSSSSYGGNPLAAVAVATTIKTILHDKLVENSRKVGAMLLGKLRGVAGEIRIHRRCARQGPAHRDGPGARSENARAALAQGQRADFFRGAQARPLHDGVFSARANQSTAGHHRGAGGSRGRKSSMKFSRRCATMSTGAPPPEFCSDG